MNYIKLWALPFVLILLIGCNNTAASEEVKLSEPFISALEELMVTDSGLNHDMAFIAIDMTGFEMLSDAEKDEIIQYFEETYKLEVKVATFEELKEQGYFNEETLVLDGILLSFEEIESKGKNEFIFTGTKYRSGLGAIGLQITVQKKNDEWNVTDSRMLWIS